MAQLHVSPCFGAPSCFFCLAEVALPQNEVGTVGVPGWPGDGDSGLQARTACRLDAPRDLRHDQEQSLRGGRTRVQRWSVESLYVYVYTVSSLYSFRSQIYSLGGPWYHHANSLLMVMKAILVRRMSAGGRGAVGTGDNQGIRIRQGKHNTQDGGGHCRRALLKGVTY